VFEMENAEKVEKIFRSLKKIYPEVKDTHLNYNTPLDLLVATILSAQCTDERVNEVTDSLFQKYEKPEDYANADIEELEEEIRPTGFYRRKAKYIKEASKTLVEEFDSKVPRTIEDLTTLPGVARKTANIVLSNAFGVVEGIAVDTHVLRLSKRLELTDEERREKVEEDLMKITPEGDWFELSNLLIAHGRNICTARNPKCSECAISELCPSAFTFS